MAPPDEIRIGDAERDAVMVALHDHFAAGRLDRTELDERLESVLTAKTRGDLRAHVRDLPSPTGLPEPAVDRHPRTAHHRYPAHHHRHLAHRHRHRPIFPVFPLLFAAFLVLAFTAGPGTGFLVVLQIALAVWVLRAVLLAFGIRRARHHAPGP